MLLRNFILFAMCVSVAGLTSGCGAPITSPDTDLPPVVVSDSDFLSGLALALGQTESDVEMVQVSIDPPVTPEQLVGLIGDPAVATPSSLFLVVSTVSGGSQLQLNNVTYSGDLTSNAVWARAREESMLMQSRPELFGAEVRIRGFIGTGSPHLLLQWWYSHSDSIVAIQTIADQATWRARLVSRAEVTP